MWTISIAPSRYHLHARAEPGDLRAIEALLEGRQVGTRNLATGRGHSNREVIAAVEKVVGRPVPVREAPRRPGDPPELVADAALFRQELGWEPRYSDLETIVRTAWAWLRGRV